MKKMISIIFVVFYAALSQASETIPEMRYVVGEEEFKPHMGLALGVGSPEGSLQSGGNYNIEIGYQPYIPISLSADIGLENYTNSGDSKLIRNSLLAKVAYNFGGKLPLIRYSYVGMGLGPMWENTEADDQMAIGAIAYTGFDYPLKSLTDLPVTLGAKISYLYTSSNNADVFAMNGVVKYWY